MRGVHSGLWELVTLGGDYISIFCHNSLAVLFAYCSFHSMLFFH